MDLIWTEHADVLAASLVGGGDTTTVAPIKNLHLHLFKNNIVPTRVTTLAELLAAEADYSGYGVDTVTFSAGERADDGPIEIVSNLAAFACTASTTPNNVYGLFGTLAGDASLAVMGRFDDAPLPMGDALDHIRVTLRARMPLGGIADVIS